MNWKQGAIIDSELIRGQAMFVRHHLLVNTGESPPPTAPMTELSKQSAVPSPGPGLGWCPICHWDAVCPLGAVPLLSPIKAVISDISAVCWCICYDWPVIRSHSKMSLGIGRKRVSGLMLDDALRRRMLDKLSRFRDWGKAIEEVEFQWVQLRKATFIKIKFGLVP